MGDGQAAGAEGLTDEEVRWFAEAFRDAPAARLVLDAAGFPAAHFPWDAPTPLLFWSAVSRALQNGAAVGGWTRLLAAAHELYPDGVGSAAEGRRSVEVVRVPPRAELLPDLPARFVSRDGDVAALRGLLLDVAAGPVVGVVGMGGAGKSTLARALVHDPAVLAAFPDGVLWVDVNAGADVTAVVAAVLAGFGSPGRVLGLTEGRERLRRLLAGAACLVVLDDVWEIEVLRALPVPGRARMLVTTRSREVLFTDSVAYQLGAVDEVMGRRLLVRYAGCGVDGLPADTDEILSRCGGLVLALVLVGGMVADGWRWTAVVERLRQADLSRLEGRFADYPHPHLLAALDASVSALGDEAGDRFRELAVFEGRGAVPAAAVARLWKTTGGLDTAGADALLRVFGRRSLVDTDAATDAINMHDLLFAFARTSLPAGRFEDLHRQFAYAFLDGWGGLEQGLPNLRSVDGVRGRAKPDPADRYAVTALVSHLLAAGRPDDVDTVLAVEWAAPAGRVENAWYTVHENLGDTSRYLAAVRAAWQDTEARRVDGDPRGLARQVTYALIVGSISSIAASIPPMLLVRLVEEQVWPPARALAYAQATPDPHTRAKALFGLLPQLPTEQLGAVFAQALAANDRRHPSAGPLIGLAEHQAGKGPDSMLAWALGEAALLEDADLRAWAMNGLAPHLPSDQRDRAADLALAAISAVDDSRAQAEALTRLAPHLSGKQRARALAVALDFRFDRVARARALSGLAPYLTAGQLARAFAASSDRVGLRARARLGIAPRPTADRLARALTDASREAPILRAWELAWLAHHLPADERGSVRAQACAAAATIASTGVQAVTLAGLTVDLARDERGIVLAQALAAVSTIGNPRDQAKTLTGLALCLHTDQRGPLPAQALAAAEAIDNPSSRAEALIGLAPLLPADQRGSALTQALAASTTLVDPYVRTEVLVELAALLSPEQRGPALTAAIAIREPFQRTKALVGLVPHLPPDLLGPALTAAIAIGDAFLQAEALVGLAPYLPADQLARAVNAAIAIRDSHFRAETLAGLAPHLPPDERPPALAQALTAAMAIGEPFYRARTLTRLAPQLSAEQSSSVFAAALAAATNIDSARLRAQALTGLAPHLTVDQRDRALAEALVAAIATAVDKPRGVARALPGLALSLFGGSSAALRAYGEFVFSNPPRRAGELTALAPLLSAAQLTEAIVAVAAIDEPALRAEALAGLAVHMPADQRDPALAQAFEAALSLDNLGSRAEALVRMATHLRADQLARALTAVSAAHPRTQSEVLRAFAPYFPVDQLAQALAVAVDIEDAASRLEALAGLAPRVSVDQLAGALAAVDIEDAVSRAVALAGLAPYLSVDQLARALTAASLVSREAVVEILPAVVTAAADPATDERVVTALLCVQRWWP